MADDAGELLTENGVFGLERFEVELAFEGDRDEGGDAVIGMEGDLDRAGAEFEANGGAAEELGEMALDDGIRPGEEGADRLAALDR